MLRYNERSWGIDLIAFINSNVRANEPIQRAGGELTIVGDSTRLFPDVLLFGDAGSGNLLQGWELKMPETSLQDEDYIDNARRKAKTLGLGSFLLWNGTDSVLYKYEAGDYVLCEDFQVSSSQIRSRVDLQNRPDLWRSQAIEIIEKLNRFIRSGKISTVSPEIVFSDSKVISIVLSCHEDVKRFLELASRNNHILDANINSWWRVVKKEHPGYDKPYGPLAYTIILRWFNRFVFSNILSAYGVLNIESTFLPPDISVNEALRKFKDICSIDDYWNIIGPGEFDEYLPESSWKILVDVFYLIQTFEFSRIEKNVLASIVNSSILVSIKKAAGLFATPPKLAELLVYLAFWDKDGEVIDPFCGTGTIIKKILEIKGDYNISGKNAIINTWGCDKFSFPVQVANLAMDISEILQEPLQIFTHDAFTLEVGEEIFFVDPKTGGAFPRKIPVFDSIISNFPFVAFEDYSQLNAIVSGKISNFYRDNNIDASDQLDGRSDLYFYIPFLLYPLIKENGTLGFLISNSWLSSEAGVQFLRLLRTFYSIELVAVSGKGKWFDNTDVIATIMVLRKAKDPMKEAIVKFVTVQESIYHINAIRDISDEIILGTPESTLTTTNYVSLDFIETIERLGIKYNSLFGNVSWLIENLSKFVCLQDVARVFRGQRRGLDRLFYPSQLVSGTIEPEYLFPLYKSSRNLLTLTPKPDALAFVCQKSLEELKGLNHTGALAWIKKFETLKRVGGQLYKDILRTPTLDWFQMNPNIDFDFMIPMNPDRRFATFRKSTTAILNQRLIGIDFYNKDKLNLMHALLNTIFVFSQIESLGFGRGQGVLDLNSSTVRKGLYIPDSSLISDKSASKILALFDEFKDSVIVDIESLFVNTYWLEMNYAIAEALLLERETVSASIDHFKKLFAIRKAIDFA